MKKNRRLCCLAAIIILYSIAAFYNLGDASSPQTYINIKADDSVIIDFGEIVNISRFNFFLGRGEVAVGFMYEVSDDCKTWDKIELTAFDAGDTGNFYYDSENKIYNYRSTFFTWIVNEVNNTARYLRITSLNNIEFYEVAVYDGDNLLPIIHCSFPLLVDEQAFAQQYKTHLNSTFFDEYYYVRSAYEIINKLPLTNLTHPPLSIDIIAASIKLFGMNPFSARFPGVIAGILMIPVFYLLADKLLRNKKFALLAAGLLALDFMHFTVSRTAMLDIYTSLFILVVFYFIADYIRKMQSIETKGGVICFLPLIWAGIFFGLASATKFSGLFSAPCILLLLLFTWYHAYNKAKDRLRIRSVIFRHFFICVVAFIIIPVLLYFLSYVPLMLSGDIGDMSPIQYFIEKQKYNISISNFIFQHDFASTAIEWPVNKKALMAFRSHEYILRRDIMYIFYILGNPIIWRTGLIAMIVLTGWAVYSRRFVPIFITAAFLSNYIVWIFSTRTGFIYYYLPCVPFIILAICYWAGFSWNLLKPKIRIKPKIKPAMGHWTHKIPAPAWSVLFGLVTASVIYFYYRRSDIIGDSLAPQRVFSAFLVLLIVIMLLIARNIWNNKIDLTGYDILKVKTMPSWIWILIASVSFIFFILFYPFISGLPFSIKYGKTFFDIFYNQFTIY